MSQHPTARYTKDFNIRVGTDTAKVGFWLGTAKQTQVLSGSIDARLCNGKIQYKNTDVQFRWYDRIDTNPNSSGDLLLYLKELLIQIPEAAFSLDFDVLIKFREKNEEQREI